MCWNHLGIRTTTRRPKIASEVSYTSRKETVFCNPYTAFKMQFFTHSCWRHIKTFRHEWSSSIYGSIPCIKPCSPKYLLAQHHNEHFKHRSCFWVPQLHYYKPQFHSLLTTLKLVQLISGRGHTDPQQKYLIRRSRMKMCVTLWSRVLLEKLTEHKLAKKFPAFYGTWNFITAFTTAHQLFLLRRPVIHGIIDLVEILGVIYIWMSLSIY
jgi:hypothetical protein